MAEKASDSTYRISGLYVTPNWNGNSDRVAMSCGLGAFIKVLRKVSIDGKTVVIAADTAGTMARSWSMTAKNTILRTTSKVYLYARVERNGANGMFIWSQNIYNIDGTTADASVVAVNNEQYYYIRVGSLEENRTEYEIDEGQYGVSWGDDEKEEVGYSWSDLIAWDRGRDLLVFLKTIAGLAIEHIILAGRELRYVLTGKDIEKDEDGNFVKTEHEESDNAVVTGGFLKAWLEKISGKFLRKDKDDSTEHKLTMGEAVSNAHHTEQFTATSGAMDGVGAGMWMLEDGTGIMETDLFYVRRAAYFRSLTIAEVKHMGGEVVLSAAACQIAYVKPLGGTPQTPRPLGEVPGYYRCYFEKSAGGRQVFNEWAIGDQARCQRFDADGNVAEGSFYWRLVVGVGEDDDFYYVDLSNEDYAVGSNPPKSNDNIVLLGHRNPTAETYDRTCAQVYSTVGIHAPSRSYYSGITSYDLTQAQRPEYLERDMNGNVEWYVGGNIGGKDYYVKYNSAGGLDIRTASMTVIADGKDVSVGEALGDNFQFFNTDDVAPRINGKVAEWISEDGINPSREEWTDAEYPNHVGDYLITSDGFTYEFVNDTEKGYGWIISSDKHLLHAQETADAAMQNLDDMASDDVITTQEKPRLNDIYTQVKEEGTCILNEATDLGLYETSTRTYRMWRTALMGFINYIVNAEGDVELAKSNGESLVVSMTRYDAVPKIEYGIPDVVVEPIIPNPVSHKLTYRDCYKWYYYYLSSMRRELTWTVNNRIDRIIAGDSDINQEVFEQIDSLRDSLFGEENGAITHIDGQLGLLASKGGNDFSGFLTTSNYASVFATGIGQDGKDLKAAITAYVNSKDSGISLTADKIDFAAGSVSVFTNGFVINSDGFKLDNDGNATFGGELKAATGTFSGNIEATKNGITFSIVPELTSFTLKCTRGDDVFTPFEINTREGPNYMPAPFIAFRGFTLDSNDRPFMYDVVSLDSIDGLVIRTYDLNYKVLSETIIGPGGTVIEAGFVMLNHLPVAQKQDGTGAALVPGQLFRVNNDNVVRIKL